MDRPKIKYELRVRDPITVGGVKIVNAEVGREEAARLRQEIGNLRKENELLKGKIQQEEHSSRRLGRTLSLLQRNKYVSNGPNNHIIERVLAQKSQQSQQLLADINALEQQRRQLKMEVMTLKNKANKAPAMLEKQRRQCYSMQAQLYVLLAKEMYHEGRETEVCDMEEDLRVRTEQLKVKNQGMRAAIYLIEEEIKSISLKEKLREKPKEVRRKEHSEVKEDEDELEPWQSEHETLLLRAQQAIEQAVAEKIEKKRELVGEAMEIELLRQEWADLLCKFQREACTF